MAERRIFYRRRLPHYQPPGATFFMTFRLAGSLPTDVIIRLRQEQENLEKMLEGISDTNERGNLLHQSQRKYFGRFDEYLDRASTGPTWLAEPKIADLVSEAVHYRDAKEYQLLSFSIMPNHVHLVFSLRPTKLNGECEVVGRRDSSPYVVTNIVGHLKWYTALKGNRLLNRTGAFWQHESYDHVVRNGGELESTVWYVLENLGKAGLCMRWRDWKWTYVKEGLIAL